MELSLLLLLRRSNAEKSLIPWWQTWLIIITVSRERLRSWVRIFRKSFPFGTGFLNLQQKIRLLFKVHSNFKSNFCRRRVVGCCRSDSGKVADNVWGPRRWFSRGERRYSQQNFLQCRRHPLAPFVLTHLLDCICPHCMMFSVRDVCFRCVTFEDKHKAVKREIVEVQSRCEIYHTKELKMRLLNQINFNNGVTGHTGVCGCKNFGPQEVNILSNSQDIRKTLSGFKKKIDNI